MTVWHRSDFSPTRSGAWGSFHQVCSVRSSTTEKQGFDILYGLAVPELRIHTQLPNHMQRKLVVFISSTSDLQPHRDAVERTLRTLEIDGSRFEAWPPSPNTDGGMAECLRQLDDADAVVLLLGSSYGSIADDGLSPTHTEYRRALAMRKPVFPFLLHGDHRDNDQEQFIAEVQETHFRGPVIHSTSQLEQVVRDALLQEYTRCFREIHGGPPAATEQLAPAEPPSPPQHLFLGDDPAIAYEYINKLYESGQDVSIQRLVPQIILKFSDYPKIMNFMHMAEVNLAMQGSVVDTDRIEQAILFWDDPKLKKLTTDYSLAYCQGNALGVLNRHGQAIAKYEYALSKEPHFAQCWKNLGTEYIAIGDAVAAERCLLMAAKHAPNLFEARYSLASLAMDSSDYNAALAHLNQIDLSSLATVQQSWVHGLKAKCSSALGDHESALRSIESAIACVPDAEWSWLWAGRFQAIARRSDDRWNQAARVFGERLISRFPQSAEAWAELGYTYWQLRATEPTDQLTQRCASAFQKALSLGFSDPLVHDRLGHLAIDAGDLPAAEASFRRAAETDAATYGYCLGTCLLKLERYADAMEWLLPAAEKHHRDALSWGQVGFCYSRLGNMPDAAVAYRKAIECGPGDAHAWFQLGGVLWNQRRLSDAVEIWTEALQQFPDDPLAADVRNLLGPDAP